MYYGSVFILPQLRPAAHRHLIKVTLNLWLLLNSIIVHHSFAFRSIFWHPRCYRSKTFLLRASLKVLSSLIVRCLAVVAERMMTFMKRKWTECRMTPLLLLKISKTHRFKAVAAAITINHRL
ncbi:hypothetical protein F4804DRAFT_250197 [Jackrogersella minutella]|nr:hypothetical protein F4804DRAFT_250197 [Jackrogersella minutella]